MVDTSAGHSRRSFLKTAGLAVVGGVVAACSPESALTTTTAAATTTSAAGATTTSAATTTTAERMLEVRFGYGNPDTTVAGFTESIWPTFAARRNVVLDAFSLSPNVSPEMLAAGRADAVAFTPITSLNLQLAGGGKPRVIVHTQPVNDYMIVANKERVPTMADLAGTNFGISEPSSISAYIPRLMAEKAGVDFETVTYVPVGGTSGRAQALLAGTIDAGAVYSDVAFQLVAQDPSLHIVGVGTDYVTLIFSSMNASEEFLDNPDNHDGIVRLLMARAEMMKFLVDEKDEFITQYLERFDADETVLGEVHDFYTNSGMWDPDLTMDLGALEETMRIALEEVDPPLAQGELPVSEWVDTSFRDEAIERLGGEGWWR
jgi:NitT/TauT family transport system substrate-binding protein